MRKFCSGCGTKLTRLKTETSWESKMRCDSCGIRVQIVYGDAMGGSTDCISERDKPFTNEEVVA